MNSNLTRILLADDHPGLRSALALLLETRLNAQIVGQAYNMEDLLACMPRVRPGIVILDWDLPGAPEIGRIAALRAAVPSLKIVITSSRPEVEEQALAARADAFICKCEPPEKILYVLQAL